MDLEHIKLAENRRAEIKAQIKALQDEDKEIVEWLDMELVVNNLDYRTQTFDCGDMVIKAKVPQSYKVNEEAFLKVTTENPDFQEIASQLFQYKLEVSQALWNKASKDIQMLFAPAVTITPGKTQYEFIKKEIQYES